MRRSSKFLGNLIHIITCILHKTLRVQVILHPNYQKETQYLAAFWHGKQYLPALELGNYREKRAVLVSPSRDGDMLCVWLAKLGYELIRGSSRRENVRSLVTMIRKVKEGYCLGLAVDGPLGPLHKVKPGTTHMAQKCEVEILPIGSAFSRKWVFSKAWDRFELPKPFAKAVLYLGNPFKVEKDVDLESANRLLENSIQEAEKIAQEYLS